MKKTKATVFILILVLTIIFPLTINARDYQIDPDDYESAGPNSTDMGEMYKFGGNIAGVIQIVGTIISVGTLMAIGIGYVVSSSEERARYRERMLPYMIGCILLFGTSSMVSIIYEIFN